MADYSIVKAEMAHVAPIGDGMRYADRLEIWLANRSTPHKALINGLVHSEKAYTVLVDGAPASMFGVVPHTLLDNRGTIWWLSTDLHKELKITRRHFQEFWRYVIELGGGYRVVENWVHEQNRFSLKLLSRMGFEIDEVPKPVGPDGAMFHHFQMRMH